MTVFTAPMMTHRAPGSAQADPDDGTRAADGSYNSTQLTSIDSQYQAILTSINQIANGSQFNGISLFTGTAVTFQVGATNTANDQLSVTIAKADTTTLAVNGTSLTSQANAQAALTKVTTALATIAGDRATVGPRSSR